MIIRPHGASSTMQTQSVYSLIERFTKQAINAGLRHYGMMSIVQRVRWHTQVETDDGTFKLNNNHAPYYARHFMQQNPQHEGFKYTPGRRFSMSAMRDLFENDWMKCSRRA